MLILSNNTDDIIYSDLIKFEIVNKIEIFTIQINQGTIFLYSFDLVFKTKSPIRYKIYSLIKNY